MRKESFEWEDDLREQKMEYGEEHPAHLPKDHHISHW